MNILNNKYCLFLSGLILTSFSSTWAQDNDKDKKIEKDVKVVQPYEPTVNEAFKLNTPPVFDDTVKVTPSVSYWIHTRRIDNTFEPKPISAAKLVPDPLPPLQKGYLKLGYGTRFTPLAELYITNTRSKKYAYGLAFDHLSSGGKVKLENDEKVFAGYAHTNANLFYNRFYRRSTFSSELFCNLDKVYDYGYNPDSVFDLSKNDIKQNYLTIGAKFKYLSNHNDSSRIQYILENEDAYFNVDAKNHLTQFKLRADIAKDFNGFYIGVATQTNINNQLMNDTSKNRHLIKVEPFMTRAGEEWRFYLGIKTATAVRDGNSQMFLYPSIKLSFVVIKNILEPYIGIDGNYDYTDMRSLCRENPFALAYSDIKGADNTLNFAGGVKGQLSSNLAYDINGSYAKISDAHFFYNINEGNYYYNRFGVVYDDMEASHINLELSYKQNNKINVYSKVSYNGYTTFKEKEAWNMPKLEGLVSANYNLRDKVMLTASVQAVGKRYARGLETNIQSLLPIDNKVELKASAYLNLGIEYRYTNKFTLFIDCKNLTNAKYYMWNQYPSQGIRLMGGFSYSL
jgi:hypothetical protein